jgi:hypothetical protein
MEIIESHWARRTRRVKRALDLYIVIFGLTFLSFGVFLSAFAGFPIGEFVIAIGLYSWSHTGRIATIDEDAITILISKKSVEIPVDQIRWIAKNMMVTFKDNFWLIVCRKQEGNLLARIYFAPNEKAYQLLSAFARMGIRLKNVPP